jgi:hypothetical protein
MPESYFFAWSWHEHMGMTDPARRRTASILTDIHFWVPLAVLIAGLLLLSLIH